MSQNIRKRMQQFENLRSDRKFNDRQQRQIAVTVGQYQVAMIVGKFNLL